MISGVAVVDKPPGWTSHDVVARCRKVFGQKKVGHAGTLDPDATGVLLVGLGHATRLLRFLTALPKSYTGEVVLGVATTTLDSSGDVVGRWDMSAVTVDEARQAARGFVGDIEQVPPMVSAVKVGGRRLHELARAGEEVERAARRVSVYRFDVHEGDDPGVLRIEVDCSSGTYVRTLAADLGSALGGGAHLRNLRRTAVGRFTVEDAVSLDALDPGAVRPPLEAVRHLGVVTVDADLAAHVRNGKILPAPALGVGGDGPWAVANAEGELLAVYERQREEAVKPAVVIATQQ